MGRFTAVWESTHSIHRMTFWVRKLTLVSLCMLFVPGFASAGIQDTPFIQEYHEAYPVEGPKDANDVRTICVDQRGTAWVGTKTGLFRWANGTWNIFDNSIDGPVYAIETDASGTVWIGAWNGLYRIEKDTFTKIDKVTLPVSVIEVLPDAILTLGPDGMGVYRDEEWKPIEAAISKNVRDAKADPNHGYWVATGVGLFHQTDWGLRNYYRPDEIYSSQVTSLDFDRSGRLWVGAWGGIDVFENGVRVRHYGSEDGLPYHDVRCLKFDAREMLWVGTSLGVARYDGKDWSLRHSKRWLVDDEVRDIDFDEEGNAWIATANGVSVIKRKSMTLAEKADYYHDICHQRHVRDPWLVEKCYFPDPSDLTKFIPKDDDNDGEYTSEYMMMESFRYAVTNDPEAKRNADRAYLALEFLQTVTGTDGFVARTVIPGDWTEMADPNRTYTPWQAVDARVEDSRYKPVEERWRLSADRKWLWKGDTSSDEITGHMSAYPIYFDLVADAAQKERVRRLVRRIMDYIIEGGYVLRDIDGRPTRWGVWAPEKLNQDPDWRVEAPINSLEILSFLKTSYHITGDEKYQREYERLLYDHQYLENIKRPKYYGIAERTHIDDILLFHTIVPLMRYETDPILRAAYFEGITWAYRTVENDQNPLFNCIFGMIGGTQFHLDDSVAFLRDQPLDLRQYTIDNSKRNDIRLVRFPMLEPLQTSRMLPPSERGVMRWDKNPWSVVSGDFSDPEGRLESSGVFWLLPYWIGRYCGFIQ